MPTTMKNNTNNGNDDNNNNNNNNNGEEIDDEHERIRKVFRDKKLEERIHEHAKSIHEYRQKNRRLEKMDNDLEVAKANLAKV